MGFWSGLGKALSVVAPIAAIPFTGGASALALGAGGAASGVGGALSKIGKIAGAAAPALTGLAAGSQKGREAENTAAQQAANFKLKEAEQNEGALENRAGLDLKQRQFAQDSNNNAYKNAIRSALAKNMQDVSIAMPNGVPKFTYSGGLRPSAMGQEGRDAAGLMNQQAMMSLMNGEKFNPLPAIERVNPATYQKPGLMENILGGAAAAGSAINGAQATAENRDFQQKIIDAINAISGQKAPGTPTVTSPVPGNGGVAPFTMPPTGRMLPPPYGDGDTSNR